MRQQGEDQQLFRNILDSIAKGTFNHSMWHILQNNSTNMNAQGARELFKDAVMHITRWCFDIVAHLGLINTDIAPHNVLCN